MTERSQLIRITLNQCAWFQAASQATRDALLAGASTAEYGSREVIVRTGEEVSTLLVLVSGALQVVSWHGEHRLVVRYWQPGEIMGLVAILDGKGSPHDAVTQGRTTVIRLPRSLILKCMADDADFSFGLIQILCGRSRSMYSTIDLHKFSPLRPRLAQALVMLLKGFGKSAEHGTLIDLRLSQDELASMLGVTRQALGRELKLLAQEGIVQLQYGRFGILDSEALSAMASQ